MDGNNRWSIKNKTLKLNSYSKGAENLINLANFIFQNTEIDTISAFALSSKNLQRPKTTINMIIKILDKFLDKSIRDSQHKFSYIFKGDLKFLGKTIITKIKKIEDITKKHSKSLIILINYSGQTDLINSFIRTNKQNLPINKDNIQKYLQVSEEPDILIRTGGFQRISDFFLFNISFTELFFTKKLWPDFNKNDFSKILNKYKKIERKFGI